MRSPSLAPPLIVAIGLVAAAMAFAVLTSLLDAADVSTDHRLARLEAAALEAEARAAETEETLTDALAEIGRLREDLSLVANRSAAVAAASVVPAAPPPGVVGEGEEFETEDPTGAVIVNDQRFNEGITQPRNAVMIEILGRPRPDLGSDCRSVTDQRLDSLLETEEVGPITVTMIRPALDSLRVIMDRLRQDEPDLYAKIGTAGGLCARLIRGSSSGISNHSWGTAIDLTMAGELDGFGDGGTQFALVILAEYFNEEGWFWGATWRREDSMHFEVGEERLREWHRAGLLGG